MSDPDRLQIAKDLNELTQNQLIDDVQIMLTDAMAAVVRGDENADDYMQRDLNDKFPRLYELSILAKGVHDSGAAVLKLCRDGDVNSAYIVARALVERSVNFAYLTVCEDEEFLAWRNYSYQKALRMINKGKRVGSFDAYLKRLPRIDLVNDPNLKSMFQPFTGKGGGEITRWSSRTFDERIGYIEGKFDLSDRVVAMLATASLFVYEIGAEVQHGTFLGVEIRRGFMPPNAVEDTYHDVALENAVLLSAISTLRSLSNFAGHPEWAEWVSIHVSPQLQTMNEGLLPEDGIAPTD
ncbi:MAG: DUF5677 domain-containing protein [Chloroflexi bacterium]|nr:DUF5677 domain-containing protein [Chloroflexota bacterium]